MKEQEILVERIEYLCRKKGISHYRLAFNSSVPITTLDNILKYRTRNPGWYTISKICTGLGVTISEFFDDEAFHMSKPETKGKV